MKTFDAYSILWVEDTTSEVDFVNGFIETYGDPLGMKASWESTVNFINKEATKRTKIISDNAQWFEDHSPVDKRFKKEKVKGLIAKVITVSMLGGDCYPATPIGINLPNADWIRRDHGSKSVTIENITEAYDKASQGNGFNEEFIWSDAEREALAKYGFLTDNLHTDLHECLGHGSGKLLPDTESGALKAYDSTLEAVSYTHLPGGRGDGQDETVCFAFDIFCLYHNLFQGIGRNLQRKGVVHGCGQQ